MEVSLKAAFNFFLFLIILAIVILLYTRCCGDTGIINLGVLTDPKGAVIITPTDQQLAHVTVECAVMPDPAVSPVQYRYKIDVKDIGIIAEEGSLLPVFIFKGSAIAAENIKKDNRYVSSEEGIQFPDPEASDPLDAKYSFYSFEATSTEKFSPIENIVIVFVNADKDIRDFSASGEKCRDVANPEATQTYNIQNFTASCERLIKGVASVTALNKCVVSGLSASVQNEKAEETGGTTRITFDLFSISGITKDDRVKIKIECNTDNSKNKFITEEYVEQLPGKKQQYQADMVCNTGMKIKVYKGCSTGQVPACSSDLLAEKER